MYFGVIDIKTNLWMLLNIVLIFLSTVMINNRAGVSSESILKSNGYTKQEVSGFTCYVKDISSVKDNAHELTFVQLVPVTQLEQSDNLEYQVAVKVTCNSNKQYFIMDKSIDDEHKHCSICSMYIGSNLIKEFNSKDNVKLQEINTHAGSIFASKVIVGISCALLVFIIIAMTIYSVIRFVSTFQPTATTYVTRYNTVLKSFSILYTFVFVLNIIILVF